MHRDRDGRNHHPQGMENNPARIGGGDRLSTAMPADAIAAIPARQPGRRVRPNNPNIIASEAIQRNSSAAARDGPALSANEARPPHRR